MTLDEFLLARIAEDEETARKATQGSWKLWGMQVLADQDGTSNIDTAVPVAHTSSEGPRPRTFNANHIARHDPARVLAECAAKRAIVEEHQDANAGDHHADPDLDLPYICVTCHDYRAHDAAEWPCGTLRMLAAIYADHEDYDGAWRP